MGLAASLYESFIGAVYYEAGFARAKEIVLETMGHVLDDIEHAPIKSAKQLLQEWAQGEKLPLPAYKMLEISGPEHHRGFEVEVEVGGHVARGNGASKREGAGSRGGAAARAGDEVSDELKVIDGGQTAPNAVLKTLTMTGFKSFRASHASRIRTGHHGDHRTERQWKEQRGGCDPLGTR
jgi:hypothetical protein